MNLLDQLPDLPDNIKVHTPGLITRKHEEAVDIDVGLVGVVEQGEPVFRLALDAALFMVSLSRVRLVADRDKIVMRREAKTHL